MTELTIKLTNPDDIKKFSHEIIKYPFDMDLTSGSNKYIIDAKSIMGIFTLNLNHNLKLLLHTENEKQINALTKDIKPFIITEEPT